MACNIRYCVVTAATIHLHGAYYQNTERDPVIRTSKGFFAREMQHIRDFRDIWPAARVQYVMLKRLKQAHEELVQRLTETSSSDAENNYCGIAGGLVYSSGTGCWAGKQNGFQLDDFFQRYPNRENYFDGAQCPFVEDMIETAAKLSLNDELGHPKMKTHSKIEKIPNGFVGAAAPHAFISGYGDGHSVPQDIQHQKQYDGAQTYSTSNPYQEKRTWDPNRQKVQEIISSSTSAGAFGYLRSGEVQSPSSPFASTCTISLAGQSRVVTPASMPAARNADANMRTNFPDRYDIFPLHTSPDLIRGYPVAINPTEHIVQQITSYSRNGPSLISTRSTHSTPLDSQKAFRSAELNIANWFAHENSAPLGSTSQSLNTRIQSLEFPRSTNGHSGNLNYLVHGGGVHMEGYNLYGGLYIDHSGPTPMETRNLADEDYIRGDDFGGSGAKARAKYVEQPDPFLLMLTQVVEEPNNSYGDLSQHAVMHSGRGEASTHMRAACESETSSAEAGILYTGSQTQPMGTGLHFGSHAQVDPTRPAVVNVGAGMVTENYNLMDAPRGAFLG